MKNIPKLLALSAALAFDCSVAIAAETITIKETNKAALLDGRCGGDEWDAATKTELPAQASFYVMHDQEYFYICVKATADDYTVLDLYIEHPQTGELHKFHLSAQMGEGILRNNKWEPASGPWELKDYAGFWVPYSGLEDRENRKNPGFARGTHRQVQISRKKFSGDTWKMMIGVSGMRREGKRVEVTYPEKAVDTDKSTWGKFLFSD
ncbi:hypothetical protein [Emcibacter sp.]|uniref:hypothetical protein n=1 Tax=Emcibacter sp. TaxID=1979954 RepID=UPI002AA61D3B|nr:hypothetical protein [Emcibacter sp.]